MATEKANPSDSHIFLPPESRVVACEVFRDELTYLGIDRNRCLFLEQGLHRYPNELNRRLVRHIKTIEETYAPRNIILVYGYCGGGLENLRTATANLIFARVHDCIHLLLGRDPERVNPDGKGTYYLTRGWILYGKTPYTDYLRLRERFGHQQALSACNDLLKAYDRVAFVPTVPEQSWAFKERSEELARFFGKKHFEIPGDLSLLKDLLQARTREDILTLSADSEISRKHFP